MAKRKPKTSILALAAGSQADLAAWTKGLAEVREAMSLSSGGIRPSVLTKAAKAGFAAGLTVPEMARDLRGAGAPAGAVDALFEEGSSLMKSRLAGKSVSPAVAKIIQTPAQRANARLSTKAAANKLQFGGSAVDEFAETVQGEMTNAKAAAVRKKVATAATKQNIADKALVDSWVASRRGLGRGINLAEVDKDAQTFLRIFTDPKTAGGEKRLQIQTQMDLRERLRAEVYKTTGAPAAQSIGTSPAEKSVRRNLGGIAKGSRGGTTLGALGLETRGNPYTTENAIAKLSGQAVQAERTVAATASPAVQAVVGGLSPGSPGFVGPVQPIGPQLPAADKGAIAKILAKAKGMVTESKAAVTGSKPAMKLLKGASKLILPLMAVMEAASLEKSRGEARDIKMMPLPDAEGIERALRLGGNVKRNDPTMYEHLRWAAGGQQEPNLTSSEVMFGATPYTTATQQDVGELLSPAFE